MKKSQLKGHVLINGKNIALTSIGSWSEYKHSKGRQSEKMATIAAIKENGAMTSRMVATAIGRERTNITRTIHDLVGQGVLVFGLFRLMRHDK